MNTSSSSTSTDDVLWVPRPEHAERSNIAAFMRWLRATRGLSFAGYRDLWRWSSTDLPAFWAAVWEFYGLDAVSSYTEVLPDASMPGARWFAGARLNFAALCLRHASPGRPALIAVPEAGEPTEISWERLRRDVAVLATTLRALGVKPGDRVAGYLPNIPEAVVALLASAAVGAVWTVCSPEFGTPSVLARFRQAEPTVLIAVNGYRYGGTEHDRRTHVAEIVEGLPTLRHLITVDITVDITADRQDGPGPWPSNPRLRQHPWPADTSDDHPLECAVLPFDHPLWILWSSGTTGTPKGIVHGHGGIAVELLKSLGLGADLRPDDRFFFVTSTSWMVWNYLVAGLLHGATIVLYDGSPTHPDLDGAWAAVARTGATMVGVGAGYLLAGQKAGAAPAARFDLTAVRSILQTGSTLPPSAWRWVHRQVTPHAWFQSVCGGTDICSALAGGTPLLPVRVGRIQCPALGVALAAWSPRGEPLTGAQGELVVTAPMPSMPLHFVNDPDGERYRNSYFADFPGVWRHGDWATIEPDLSVVIAGRSDSTLNRMGVRMGSADIYAVVEQLPEIADSLVIGAELADGGYLMPLFVVLAAGATFDDELKRRINSAIRRDLSPRHVPDYIVAIPAVPRTLTGKKLEIPIKRILQGTPSRDVASEGTITHPEMLTWFARHTRPPSA